MTVPLNPTESSGPANCAGQALSSSHPPDPRPPRRVLIVEDDTLVGMGIKSMLERLGHVVVGQAATRQEAIALFSSQQPDLVLMDIRLDDVDGIELTRELLTQRRCPVVILSAYSDPELIQRAADAGVFGYLVKPVTREALAAQIQVAIERFEEREQLRDQRDQAAQALEARKLIERAKGILMKRLKLSEPDAHRRLQIESQKRRISMTEIARKVIESESLLGD